MKTKIKKLLLSLVLAVVAVVAVPQLFVVEVEAVVSGTCGDDVTWSLNTDTLVLSFNGTGNISYSGSQAPWYDYRSYIKEISISSGVTGSTNSNAFADFTSLKKVHYYGELANWCSMKFSGFSSNPAFYADELYICGKLIEGDLVLPDNITVINDYVFSGYSYINSVIVGNNIENISHYAFSLCFVEEFIVDENNEFYSNDEFGVLFNKDKSMVIQYPIGNYRNSYTIPDSVTAIGNDAFRNSTRLEKVVISDSVSDIGDYAFYFCPELTELTIPASAKICNSSYTFLKCDNIEKVIITKGTGEMCDYTSSTSSDITYYQYTPWYISACDKIIIEDGVTTIGNYAFFNCTEITNIIIPDSVRDLGNYAFSDCTGLTSLTIPGSVKSIGSYAFSDCTGLTDVYYNGDIVAWCAISFNNSDSNPMCSTYNLYIDGDLIEGELEIPNTVTSISSYAFYNCTKLTDIHYTGDVADWCTINFNNSYSNPMCYANNLYIDEKLIENELVISGNIKSIGKYAFYNCTSLISVIIPDSVTTIGNYSFYGCANLTSVTIPDSVTSIGNYAFRGCVGLANITIPNSVTTIGDSAFYGCSGITELIMPVSAKIYNSSRTFGGCSNIQKVTLTAGTGIMPNYGTSTSTSSSVTNYKYTPWYISRNSIRELIIEDGVKNIGAYAFCNCIGLESLIIPNSVTNIGAYALCDCIGLESLIIPDSVTNISGGAFQGMTNLESLTLPFIGKSRDAIAYEAVLGFVFGYETYSATTGMSSLNSSTDFINSAVGSSDYTWQYTCCNNEGKNSRYFRQSYYFYIPDSLKTVTVTDATIVNTAAFMNCINLVKISLNDNLTTIDGYAFYKCTGLTSITIPKSVTGIVTFAFSNCSKLTTVFFAGTEEEWNTIGYNNWSDPKPTVFFNHAEHLAGEWETEIPATCISEGLSIKKCAICQEVLDSQIIPQKNEHEYIEKITTYPTCTTAGMKTFTCVCGDSYTEVLPATGHSLRRVSVAPTCTEEGKICYQCQNCLAEFNVTVVPTTGHSYKEEIVSAPTCTAAGKTKYTCHCGDSYTVTTPMLEHDMVRYYTAPTCLEPGMEYYICNSCGNMIGDMEIIPETGHIYGWAVVAAPTATESGSKKQVCTVCGEETGVVETIPATGFEPTNGMIVDYANNIVYGLDAGVNSLDSYTNVVVEGYEWTYTPGQFGGFGTGTKATLKNGDETVAEYIILIYGDLNGDGWYDGEDAFLVNLIAKGMLDKDDVGSAIWTAADCNHDGEINETDVDLLSGAGLKLNDVDQTKPVDELATNSDYIEYVMLIDQSAGMSVEPDIDNSQQGTTDSNTAPEQPADEIDIEAILTNIFEFFKKLFTLVFSFVIK